MSSGRGVLLPLLDDPRLGGERVWSAVVADIASLVVARRTAGVRAHTRSSNDGTDRVRQVQVTLSLALRAGRHDSQSLNTRTAVTEVRTMASTRARLVGEREREKRIRTNRKLQRESCDG